MHQNVPFNLVNPCDCGTICTHCLNSTCQSCLKDQFCRLFVSKIPGNFGHTHTHYASFCDRCAQVLAMKADSLAFFKIGRSDKSNRIQKISTQKVVCTPCDYCDRPTPQAKCLITHVDRLNVPPKVKNVCNACLDRFNNTNHGFHVEKIICQ